MNRKQSRAQMKMEHELAKGCNCLDGSCWGEESARSRGGPAEIFLLKLFLSHLFSFFFSFSTTLNKTFIVVFFFNFRIFFFLF